MRRNIAALAVFLAVWIAGYVVFARVPTAPETPALQTLTRSEAFLSGTRGDGVSQCLALPYQDPDIVAIGSSHVGAGIDAQRFAERSRLPTGICALPRWNTDTLEQFVDYLDRREIHPQRIIWFADLTSHLRNTRDAQRLAASLNVFSDERLWSETAILWQARQGRGQPQLEMSARQFRDSVAAQERNLARLDVNRVRDRLEENRDLIFARVFAMDRRFFPHPDWASNVSSFCEALDARGIALDVVITPIPNQTAKLTDFDAKAHLRMIMDAMPCVDRGIARDLQSWSLDERHFIKLQSQRDVELWNLDSEGFAAHVEKTMKGEISAVFDIDHLNAVGAEIFTAEVVKALGLSK